jgi:hypothetical protein
MSTGSLGYASADELDRRVFYAGGLTAKLTAKPTANGELQRSTAAKAYG